MLAVKLICVGKMRERFYIDAFAEYAKRLGAYCRFDCVQLQEQRLPDRPSQTEIKAALAKEGLDIVKYIPEDAYVAAMCVEGEQLSSEELGELIVRREGSGRPKLCFVIGGSYGLAEEIKARAQLRLSLSRMTFPHHLARVILAEQLYRAFTIKEGAKYHK